MGSCVESPRLTHREIKGRCGVWSQRWGKGLGAGPVASSLSQSSYDLGTFLPSLCRPRVEPLWLTQSQKVGLASAFAKQQLEKSWDHPRSVLSIITAAGTSVLSAEASSHSWPISFTVV